MNGRWLRNSFIYLLILVAIVAIVFTVLSGGGDDKVDQELSQFISQAQAGDVVKVDVDGETLNYELSNDDATYTTKVEQGDTVRQILQDAGVEPGSDAYPVVEIKDASAWKKILSRPLCCHPRSRTRRNTLPTRFARFTG